MIILIQGYTILPEYNSTNFLSLKSAVIYWNLWQTLTEVRKRGSEKKIKKLNFKFYNSFGVFGKLVLIRIDHSY